jgi:hypothetical protein
LAELTAPERPATLKVRYERSWALVVFLTRSAVAVPKELVALSDLT